MTGIVVAANVMRLTCDRRKQKVSGRLPEASSNLFRTHPRYFKSMLYSCDPGWTV